MVLNGNKKYIISGTAGSGKSTLIHALSSKGYSCIKEVSRDIITCQQVTGGDAIPWIDIKKFTDLVYQETLFRVGNNPLAIFCDRSLVDNLAYLKKYNGDIPSYLAKFDFHQLYQKKVYYTSPWKSIYRKDPQRPGEYEEQIILSKLLLDTYIDLGFEIVHLPFCSVEKRVEFIKNDLDF